MLVSLPVSTQNNFQLQFTCKLTQIFLIIPPVEWKNEGGSVEKLMMRAFFPSFVCHIQTVWSETAVFMWNMTGKESRSSGQRGNADEIIIVRNGLLSDTSYSNIALFDGTMWVTPKTHLSTDTLSA
jgi:hypothetical protein